MTRTRASAKAAGSSHERAIYFEVAGHPSPKGSLRHVGGGHLVEQVKGSKPWRVLAAHAAREAMNGEPPWSEAAEVSIDIFLIRPKTSRHIWPITRSSGDVDKHARNILDALVDGGVLVDDSQVCSLAISKSYRPEEGAIVRVTI